MHSTNSPNMYSGNASSIGISPGSIAIAFQSARQCRPPSINTTITQPSAPYQPRRYQPVPSKQRMNVIR